MRAREDEREERPLSYVPSKRKEEIKSGTSGCGSFVVPYFQPAISTTDHLHLALRAGLEVGKPNNIPANNRRAPNSHSQRGQRKNYSGEQLNFFCNLCQALVCPKCPPDGHKDHPWVLLKWATAHGYAPDACNSRSQEAREVQGRFTSTGVCAFWAAGADWQRQGIDHRDVPFDFHLCQGMAQVDVTIKKIKIKTGFLFIIPLYRTLQKCSKTSKQFSAYWKVAA